MKSPVTTSHLIAAVSIVTVVTVTMLLLHLPTELIALVDSLVGPGLVGLGLIPAADQSTVNDLSSKLSAQVVTAVQAAKDDLMALHAANAANTAAIAQTVAVHAALIPSAPPPPPLIVAPASIVTDTTSNTGPHLVS